MCIRVDMYRCVNEKLNRSLPYVTLLCDPCHCVSTHQRVCSSAAKPTIDDDDDDDDSRKPKL